MGVLLKLLPLQTTSLSSTKWVTNPNMASSNNSNINNNRDITSHHKRSSSSSSSHRNNNHNSNSNSTHLNHKAKVTHHRNMGSSG